mmetsp:Transcript_13707/g.24757  ORF Transcript_13707/g.24757 Transcript_13707/m.24757 type:complete len:127 (+) Transcript_13707:26-406(+)
MSAMGGEGKSGGDDDPRLEIHRKKMAIGKQLINLRGHLQMKERACRSTELTIAEMKAMPDDCKTYKTVGRMFLATPIKDVRDGLKKFLDDTASEITQLKSKQKYLEKEAKSVTDELTQAEAEMTGG